MPKINAIFRLLFKKHSWNLFRWGKTSYSRGYNIGSEIHKDIFAKTVILFIIYHIFYIFLILGMKNTDMFDETAFETFSFI